MKHKQPDYPFRFGNRAAGTLVLVAIAFAVLVFIQYANVQQWFAGEETFFLALPETGSHGLRRGSEVELLGTPVGRVEHIEIIDNRGSMEAEITIREDFAAFVRGDSTGLIKRRLGIAGDAYVQLTTGSLDAPAPGQRRLTVAFDRAPTETLDEVMSQIRNVVVPAVNEFRAGSTEWKNLALTLQDDDDAFQRWLDGMARLSDALVAGEGLFGRMFLDEAFATTTLERFDSVLEDTARSLENARDISDSMRSGTSLLEPQIAEFAATLETFDQVVNRMNIALDNVVEVTEVLPGVVRNVAEETEDLPGLVLQVQSTFREMEILVRALQNHWLIRGSVQQPDLPPTLPPSFATPAESVDP